MSEVHHVEDAAALTACGKYLGTGGDLLANIYWRYVTCADCLRFRALGKESVRHLTPEPVEHDKRHAMEPVHKHDCEACVLLDSVMRERRDYDIYFCPGNSKPTVVVRFSSSGPDYYSGLAFAEKDPLVALGLVLALKRGLIRFEDALKFL